MCHSNYQFQSQRKSASFTPGPDTLEKIQNWVERESCGRKFILKCCFDFNSGLTCSLPCIYENPLWTKQLQDLIAPLTPARVTKIDVEIERLPSHCQLCGQQCVGDCASKCLFCTKDLNDGHDHTKCVVVLYECSSCHQSFTSSGRRRSHMCGEVQLETSAIDGYFRIYNLVIPALPSADFFNIMMDSKSRIRALLRQLLDEMGALKFYLTIEMMFKEVIGDREHVQHFTTSATELLENTILEKVSMEHLLKLIQRVDDFIALGSGWIVLTLNSVKLNVTPFNLHEIGSYIETPKELESKRRCLVNIENRSDHLCFLWCIVADDHHLETRNPTRQSFYTRFMNEYDVTGIKFPMTIEEIGKFEDLNGRGVNVIGWKKKYGFYTERRSKGKFPKVTNLLRITDENLNFHYILITNLPRLLCTAKNGHMHFVCLNCHTLRASQKALDEHEKVCDSNGLQTVRFPKENYLEFNAFRKTVAVPVWVILDLESMLLPEDGQMGNQTAVLSEHIPCSYALKVCSDDYEQWNLPVEYYDGPHCAEYLVRRLEELYDSLKPIIFSDEKIIPLTPFEERHHETAPNCHICLKPFLPTDTRVKDHDHYPLRSGQTSNYIGPAHSICNQQRKTEKHLTIIAHNLSSYDMHLFIKEICQENRDVLSRVKLLPKNLEKYISVKTPHLRFIDSYRHLNSSLDSLVKDLDGPMSFKNVRDYVHNTLHGNDEDVQLLSRKGIFCYNFIDSPDRLADPIPGRSMFYNDLTDTSISDDEWNHLQRVIQRFDLVTVGDLLKIYNILDVLLTADVWSGYRSWCLENMGLEPAHYVSGPSFSWDASLKMTRPRLQYLKDTDMHLMIESSLRGGISNVVKRYATANNPYVPG